MNPGLTSLLLPGLSAEHGPPLQKRANCIWLSVWMKASHFWMSRQATGRSVIQQREYMRLSACADAISWRTSRMEVAPLVSRCSVFVSTYSGSWLRHLGRFSWEVTAPCSPFPSCPCSYVGGAHSRAGVAEISHCTGADKSTGTCALGVEGWVQAALLLPPVHLVWTVTLCISTKYC